MQLLSWERSTVKLECHAGINPGFHFSPSDVNILKAVLGAMQYQAKCCFGQRCCVWLGNQLLDQHPLAFGNFLFAQTDVVSKGFHSTHNVNVGLVKCDPHVVLMSEQKHRLEFWWYNE